MTNDKKKGRTSGCLKLVAIGFVIFLILGFIATWSSNKEWKKDRPDVLAAITRAVETGDYESALSLAEPHKLRDDSAINDLISKAEDLKRQAQEKAKQERILARQAKIADLVAKIKDSKGEDRGRMLHELLSLDPRTAEFPDEIAAIREHEKKLKEAADAEIAATREREKKFKQEVDDFVANSTGKKFSFDKSGAYGSPETLEGTNNKYWLAYLPKIDVSLVTEKTTDNILFVGRGKKAGPDYLANKDAARKKRLEGGFSAWDGSHSGLTKVIKEAMNDPKSYEHADTKYRDMGDHLIVTTTYRGKNAFGGVVKNWVQAKTDLDGNVLKIIDEGP